MYLTWDTKHSFYDSDTEENQIKWRKRHQALPKKTERWQCNHCKKNRIKIVSGMRLNCNIFNQNIMYG